MGRRAEGLRSSLSASRPCLCVEVPPSDGRQRWFTIGKHGSPWTADLARREAKRLLGLVASGQDPATKKAVARTAPTVAELADLFLSEHVEAKNKGSTHSEYARLVERLVKPQLGSKRADEVTHEEVRRLHVKLRATPYQANRLIALLSKMFSWSGRRGESNPCTGIERFGEKKRRRYLSTAELGRLGEALAAFENRRWSLPPTQSQLSGCCC